MYKFNNFKIHTLSNKWIKVYLAPEIGGRIIQLNLDGYDYLFNNELPTVLDNYKEKAEKGIWINYGGEKLWPAPQGWGMKTHWPGPPDAILDGGKFTITENNEYSSTLISEIDEYTGLQIQRDIKIDDHSTFITVNCRFTNKSATVKRWSIWPVAQLSTKDFDNNDYELIIPLNRQSKHNNGYFVMHGLANNPQFKSDKETLKVNYQYLIGKIGSDTNRGWVAYCNKSNGKTYVVFFKKSDDNAFPDDSTVQIWTQGKGMIFSRNIIKEFPNDTINNPPYLEIELLSPLKNIEPSDTLNYSYQIALSNIPIGLSVKDVNHQIITCEKLSAHLVANKLFINAAYGVFAEGTFILTIYRDNINVVYTEKIEVNPLSPISLLREVRLDKIGSSIHSIELKHISSKNIYIVDKIKL